MRMRSSTLGCLVVLLGGCPSDDGQQESSSTSSTTSDTTATTQPEATTSGPGGTSTGAADSGSTTDTPGGSTSTSGGDPIGCEPGAPCCNDAGEWEECFLDESTQLVWELDPGGGNPTLEGAQTYCSNLTLLGSSGWRVPTLDELRTLARGCPDIESGGACEVAEDCATLDCRNDACDGCSDAPNEGPAMFGCYWNPNLLGTCDRYWTVTDPGEGLGWVVDFDDASVRQADFDIPAGLVRCVASLSG